MRINNSPSFGARIVINKKALKALADKNKDKLPGASIGSSVMSMGTGTIVSAPGNFSHMTMTGIGSSYVSYGASILDMACDTNIISKSAKKIPN